MNTLRTTRKEQGLCVACGEHPHIEGKLKCIKCTAKYAVFNSNRFLKLKSKGLCAQCGKYPLVPESTRCIERLDKIHNSRYFSPIYPVIKNKWELSHWGYTETCKY